MRTKLKLLLVWYIGNIGWNLLQLVNKGRIDHLNEVIAALSLSAFLLTSPPFIPIAFGCAFFCLIIFACRINLYAVPLSFALGCLFAVFVMLSSIVPALLGIVSALGPWGVAHQSVEFPVLSIGEAWSRTAFVVAADALFVGTLFVCHRIALHDDPAPVKAYHRISSLTQEQ